jgi:hypothetical protein
LPVVACWLKSLALFGCQTLRLFSDVHHTQAVGLRDLLPLFVILCGLEEVVKGVCLIVCQQAAMVFECGRGQLGGLEQLGGAHIDVSHLDTMALEPLICLLGLLLVLVVHAFIYADQQKPWQKWREHWQLGTLMRWQLYLVATAPRRPWRVHCDPVALWP